MSEKPDTIKDAGLSEVYSQLSNETTPAELDSKILDAARPSARLGNLLSLKPLSWAAITVLSIGLVLELQRSTPDLVPDEAITVPMQSVELEKRAPLPSSADTTADTTERTDTGLAAEQPIAEPSNRSLRTVREEVVTVEPLNFAPAAPTAQLYEDLDDLKIAPKPESYCEDIELVDASSWYSCVLRLRDEGRVDEAAQELSLLMSKFPDFEIR